MSGNYTAERNVLLLISLLKKHGIKKIIASPGTTNITFVESIKSDNYFEIFSAPDERSAGYMACGLSAESAEPVALTCTGATASRNYIPGLTEAYYRKLPVLAITSSQHYGRIGNNHAQVIDRTQQLKDICVYSERIYTIACDEDEWDCNLKINIGLMKLRCNGGGPVHFDLQTSYKNDYSIRTLPDTRKVSFISNDSTFPEIVEKRVAVYVGNHLKWDDTLTKKVEEFCEKYNACVIMDHTSNYAGKYGVLANILTNQEDCIIDQRNIELLIDIGEVSGAYIDLNPKRTWRICADGSVKDRFHTVDYVFNMSEVAFFAHYCDVRKAKSKTTYYTDFQNAIAEIRGKLPEIPFSNPWMARRLSTSIPANSVVHLGILNSLRSWNYFETDSSIRFYSNTGGFGIDGGLSSLIGASLHDAKKLYFGIIGDLAFFYDMNSLGNINVGNNLRILLINNGCGTEFRNYNHPAMILDSNVDASSIIAAIGHYGNKSKELVKHYVTDLGFTYLSANNKSEFEKQIDIFTSKEINKSIVLEAFTDSEDESKALYLLNHILAGPPSTSDKAKKVIKQVLGDDTVRQLKHLIRK